MNDKLLGLLGIARRSGNLKIGFEECNEAIKAGKAKLVLVASDTAARTEKELVFSARQKPTEIIRADFDKFRLSSAIGTSAGVVATCDQGFAKRATELINQGGNLQYDD